MKRFLRGLFLVGGAALGTSVACSSPSFTAGEQNAVLTRPDAKTDFSAYKTYALGTDVIELCGVAPDSGKLDPDGISDVGAGGAGGAIGAGGADSRDGLVQDEQCYEMDHSADEAIWEAIDENMKARSFEKVGLDENPDVVVLAAHVSRITWAYAPTYVWCDPAFGYQCWYPKETLPYELAAGSVSLLMVDPKASKLDDLKNVWFASLSGVYNADLPTFVANVGKSVGQAFSQSTVIQAGEK